MGQENNLRDTKTHKRQTCTIQESNIKDSNLRHTVIQLPIKSKAILQPVTCAKQNSQYERNCVGDFTFDQFVL